MPAALAFAALCAAPLDANACIPTDFTPVGMFPADGSITGPNAEVWLLGEGQSFEWDLYPLTFELDGSEITHTAVWYPGRFSTGGIVFLTPDASLEEGTANTEFGPIASTFEVRADFVPPDLPAVSEVRWASGIVGDIGSICEVVPTDTLWVDVTLEEEPEPGTAIRVDFDLGRRLSSAARLATGRTTRIAVERGTDLPLEVSAWTIDVHGQETVPVSSDRPDRCGYIDAADYVDQRIPEDFDIDTLPECDDWPLPDEPPSGSEDAGDMGEPDAGFFETGTDRGCSCSSTADRSDFPTALFLVGLVGLLRGRVLRR